MNEFITWLTWLSTLNPGWIMLIFPMLFGSVALSCWRDHLKQKKLEANPINMDEHEYRRFNRKRFRK
jgi:hypothetical protein